MINTFEDLGLNAELVKAVSDLGFSKPTPVQEAVIPKEMNSDNDIVCLAQTGTGKTAAFGLPLIQSINPLDTQTQALVLCPTRELCRQISQDIVKYAKYTKGFSLVAVYGGSSIESQIKALRKGAHVIVATPGRMVDLLERKAAKLGSIKKLILDEADEMLDMGFKEELDTILSFCPQQRRTLLFSATLPMEVERIAKKYMDNPEVLTIGKRNQGSENVKHYYYLVQEKNRYAALKRIVDYYPNMYAIVFCRTRKETQDVADALIHDGYNAEALHGDLSQAQRDLVMSRFRNRMLSLLVATDVAARGIDVSDLTHVLNYNLPDEPEQYTHRSGRTGRADKSGISIAIINVKEQYKIKRIEKVLGKSFGQAKVPTGKEVCSKQLIHLIDQMEKTEVKSEIADYLKVVEYKWAYLSKEDIISKVLSIEFNRFLDYYRNSPDLNISETQKAVVSEENESRKDSRSGRESRPKSGKGNVSKRPEPKVFERNEKFEWLILNVGIKDKITNRNILRLLTSCGLGKKSIGIIDLQREECRLEIDPRVADSLASKLDGSSYRGKVIRVSRG